MESLTPWIAAAVAAVAAWFAVRYQHLLYREPRYREERAGGRKLLALRLFATSSAAGAAWLAFRPDHYDAWPALLTAAFCFVLVVLSSTDFERKLLPNALMYPAMLAAIACFWSWPDRDPMALLTGAAFAVGIAAGLFLLGFAFGAALGVKGTSFGVGDVKLIVLLGLLCGWPAVTSALIFGVLLAGIPGLIMIVTGKGKSFYSYGPYLALGGIIVLLFPASFV